MISGKRPVWMALTTTLRPKRILRLARIGVDPPMPGMHVHYTDSAPIFLYMELIEAKQARNQMHK